jgi:hypothetical protein
VRSPDQHQVLKVVFRRAFLWQQRRVLRRQAQLDRVNLFYHEASGEWYIQRTVLSNFESGMIDAVRASPLG